MYDNMNKEAQELMPGLTEGRIVHYVLASGRNQGQHRPAIVVRDWKQPNGLVQLQVFTDETNDYAPGVPGSNGIFWATSVIYSEGKEPGTWHWIEKA